MRIGRVWEPLWKNISSKVVSNDEELALEKLSLIVDDKKISADTCLDINGHKILRFKKQYSESFEIPLYDYFLLGPVTFNDRNVFCRQYFSVGIGKPSNQMSVLMNDEEIALQVNEYMRSQKAWRALKGNKGVLDRFKCKGL